MVQVQVDLTPLEMRKIVVEDVLKQLNNRKLQVKRGAYIRLKTSKYGKQIDTFSDNTQIQEVVNKIQSQCKACAIGSCFLSYVRKFNNCTFADVGLDSDGSAYISQRGSLLRKMVCFDKEQLDLIECAFEAHSQFWHIITSTFGGGDKRYDAKRFGLKYKSDRQRLIAIMNNMVENNYEFTP